jgi:deoxyribodipyrimidine photo-lyase
MLVSFICNTLLLDWRKPALTLAQLFLDYEPGIHYSQMQMQAGVTGFNTIRIYNPVKQSQEHDPQGFFLRKFMPELRSFPDEQIHEPWLYGGTQPMVDLVEANRRAREVLWGVKRTREARDTAAQQLVKHGSRKGTFKSKRIIENKSEQLEFEFDE